MLTTGSRLYSIVRCNAALGPLAVCCCLLLPNGQLQRAGGAEPGENSHFIVIGAIELPGAPKIYRINTDGSNRVLLRLGGFDPALSPDGKQIAFMGTGNEKTGLYLINIDGSGLKQIAQNSGGISSWLAPRWSPDGKRIAFCTPFPDAMFVVDVDGNNLRRVGIGGGLFPNWSPDGRQLLFTRISDGPPNLFVIDVDDIEHKRLLDGTATMGTWSPDGQWLAYVVMEGKRAGLYVAEADGTLPKRLAGGPNEITINPEWSRDSKRIFFTWMAGIETKEVSEILAREAAGLEAIDNSERPAPSAVHVIDLDGQNLRRITNADSMEYSGGSLLYIQGHSEWSDLAERRMPTTSWEEVPAPKAAIPVKEKNKAAIEWVKQIGGIILTEPDPTQPYAVVLNGCPITDDDFARIGELTNMEGLHLTKIEISDAGLRHIAEFKNLRTLLISEVEITDEGLKTLAKSKTLRKLHLHESKVTDAGLRYLQPLESLQVLGLPKAQIADSTLRILHEIDKLNLIDTSDLRGTQVTDTGLRELAGRDEIKTLNLQNTAITDAGLDVIATLNKLETLNLESTKVTDEGLSKLVGLPNLQTIYLHGTAVTHVGVQELKHNIPELVVFPRRLGIPPLTVGEQKAIRWAENLGGTARERWSGTDADLPLTQINLENSQVTDADLNLLATLNGVDHLYSLILRMTRVTDAGLKDVTKLSTLRRLDLGDTKVTDAGIGALAELQELKSLDLGGTPVTGVGLEPLSKLKQLAFLNLRGSRISDAGLKNVGALKNLESLDLDDTGVTASGLRNLAGLTRLQNLRLDLEAGRGRQAQMTTVAKLHALREAGLLHAIEQTEPRHGSVGPRPTTAEGITNLTLYDNWLTDAALREFADFKNVQDIQLDGSKISDSGLKTVGTFKQLRRLSLSNTRVTDAGLKELAGLTALQDLKLEGTQVGDPGLKFIGGLKSLQWLDLANTEVTDKGLKELTELKQLQRLLLYGTNVTKAGLTDLRKALPQLRVVHPLVP